MTLQRWAREHLTKAAAYDSSGLAVLGWAAVINDQRPNGTVIGLIRLASKRVAISQVERGPGESRRTCVGGSLIPERNSPKPFIDDGGVSPSARAATRFCNSFDRMAIQGYL